MSAHCRHCHPPVVFDPNWRDCEGVHASYLCSPTTADNAVAMWKYSKSHYPVPAKVLVGYFVSYLAKSGSSRGTSLISTDSASCDCCLLLLYRLYISWYFRALQSAVWSSNFAACDHEHHDIGFVERKLWWCICKSVALIHWRHEYNTTRYEWTSGWQHFIEVRRRCNCWNVCSILCSVVLKHALLPL